MDPAAEKLAHSVVTIDGFTLLDTEESRQANGELPVARLSV
jgi:hypothetical protein